MTDAPSYDAIRSRLWRERQKALLGPALAEVKAKAAAERRRIAADGRAAAALMRVQKTIAVKLREIEETQSPWARAALLGKLSDWISSSRFKAIMKRVREIAPAKGSQMRRWLRG